MSLKLLDMTAARFEAALLASRNPNRSSSDKFGDGARVEDGVIFILQRIWLDENELVSSVGTIFIVIQHRQRNSYLFV